MSATDLMPIFLVDATDFESPISYTSIFSSSSFFKSISAVSINISYLSSLSAYYENDLCENWWALITSVVWSIGSWTPLSSILITSRSLVKKGFCFKLGLIILSVPAPQLCFLDSTEARLRTSLTYFLRRRYSLVDKSFIELTRIPSYERSVMSLMLSLSSY